MTQHVLPAHVYDALQLSAEMYGGIGGVDYFTNPDWIILYHHKDRERLVPSCYLGHLWCAGLVEMLGSTRSAFGISWYDNDEAVRTINKRNDTVAYVRGARVSFDEWCAELNVVRGAEPVAPLHRDREYIESDDAALTVPA